MNHIPLFYARRVHIDFTLFPAVEVKAIVSTVCYRSNTLEYSKALFLHWFSDLTL